MFSKIIRSPTRQIILFYESGNSRQAFQFLAFSAAIYFLIGLSRFWIIREHDLVVGLVLSLQFVITLTVSIPIFYKMSVSRSPQDRTLHEFLVLSSLYIGVNIVLVGIAMFVMIVNIGIGGVLLLSFLVPMSIYTLRVLKYFWEMSTGRILFNAGVGGFAGAVVSGLFLLACAAIFDIQIAPL